MSEYKKDSYVYNTSEIFSKDYTSPSMDDIKNVYEDASRKYMYATTTSNTVSNTAITTNDLINGNWTSNSINSIWNTDYSIRQPFSKSEFLQSLSKGVPLKQSVQDIVKHLNDDGVIDFIEFLTKLGLLDKSIFWELAYESHHVYIMGQQHHTVSDCVKFIEYTHNNTLVSYTRDDVRNNKQFCKHINTLKLKGVI